MLPQDTTHLIQRPRYQRRSMCQDPAGNQTTRRPPDHRKEIHTEVVWTCLLLIRSGQNHLARHSEMGKKTRCTEKQVGRQIKEWTGLEFAKSKKALGNRVKWRNWLQSYLWCPNDLCGEGESEGEALEDKKVLCLTTNVFALPA